MTKHHDPNLHEIKKLAEVVYSQSGQILKARSLILKNKIALFIASKPLQAMGIAAVIGLILGRRMKK